MDGVILPYLPTVLWVFGGAVTILLLLIVFGFYIYCRKREAALIEDSSDVAELSAKKQILQADVEALRQWMDEQKAETDRLKTEREEQERLRSILADLEQQCATKDQENQALRNEVGELENQRYILTQTLDKLEREIGDIDAKRVESEAIERRLIELKTKLKEAQDAAQGIAETQAKLEALTAEKTSLERAVEDLRSTVKSAQTATDQHKQDAQQARSEAERLRHALGEIRRERSELDVIVDTLRHEQNALSRGVERLEQRIDNLKASSKAAIEETRKYVLEAKKARDEAKEVSQQLLDLHKDKMRLEIDVGELNARKAVIEQELIGLEGKPGIQPEEVSLAAYADLLEKPPACLNKDSFAEEREEQDETIVLSQLKITLRNEGLIFSSRVVDAFHTSLKCQDINPITVLAGVSGTGKTLLPMRYADIVGMHRLVMAVQPRWDSPQDMFGFYNYLEKEYKATELSRALIRMDPYNYNSDIFENLDSDWSKDRLLIVLLDEMNLARTEYYFSEFLSKLELRRAVKEPSVSHKRSQSEIELDVGPSEHRFRLWIDHNVFFVGTLNEDETTQTLSDKVLDRANVIRFGKPDEKAIATNNDLQEQKANEGYLPSSKWFSWQHELDEGVADYQNEVRRGGMNF